MKKIFNYFMLAAAAVVAFASCAKNVEEQFPVENGVRMKTITVMTDIQTKTTLDSNHENIVWSAGDKISIFNDQDNTNLQKEYEQGGNLIVSVPEATKVIYAHYPYWSGNSTGPKTVSILVSNNQTQKNPGELNGHYFPMVAKGTVTADNKALISLYPVASALALNIYKTGLSATEKVLSVKVTPEAANTQFIGSQSTDITGDKIIYSQAASSNPITVTLTNALTLGNSKPDDKQTFEGQIYVCLAKQSYKSVKFEITTDAGIYTITSSNETAFDCVNNDFVPININLSSSKASFTPHVTLNGNYLIVSKHSDNWTIMTGLHTGSTNYFSNLDTQLGTSDYSADNINFEDFADISGIYEYAWTFTKMGDQYSISRGSDFLTWKSGNSADLTDSETAINFDVVYNPDDHSAVIKHDVSDSESRYLKFNSGSPRFAFYTSGQQDIYLIPTAADTRSESSIVVNENEELFVGQTKEIEFEVEPEGATVTLALGNGAANYVSVNGTNVTGVAKTTTSVPVELSFAGNSEYKPSSEIVNVTVYNVPALQYFSQTKTGFEASLNEMIDGFSYSWKLYHNSVADENIVSSSNRTISSTTFSGSFADDLTISSFTIGGTYLLVVTASKGELSASSNSESFTAADLDNISRGDEWSYTFTAQVWGAAGSQSINDRVWTMAGEGGPYFDYDSNNGRGQQFGSGSKPYSALTLSSNFGEAYGIDAIQVSTSGASSINATVSVSVGGTSFKCGESTSVSLTASNTVYEFVSPDGNLKAGEIVISYDNSSSKAIYVKKIVVNPAPAQQLTMSDITCTSHTSSSLTFEWPEVSGASGYQVSINGEDFGSTQQGRTYTLSDLEPETSYSIWVKAIGDGISWITSAPKKSSVGTTDATPVGPQEYTVTWTASAAANLGKTISSQGGTDTGYIVTSCSSPSLSYDWSYTRTLVTLKSGKADYLALSDGYIQMGSSNALESAIFSTSAIPGIIKSVAVDCWSYNGQHNLKITVGGNTYLSESTPSSGSTVTASGSSSGDIVISMTDGSRALYIKSITVVYEN